MSGTTTTTAATTPTLTATTAAGREAQVNRLYDTVFDRAPDSGGLAFWTDALNSGRFTIEAVADAFVASPEFAAGNGNPANAAFVGLMYRNGFGREAESAGSEFWTGALQRNVFDRGDVALRISESAEGQASPLTRGVPETPSGTSPGTGTGTGTTGAGTGAGTTGGPAAGTGAGTSTSTTSGTGTNAGADSDTTTGAGVSATGAGTGDTDATDGATNRGSGSDAGADSDLGSGASTSTGTDAGGATDTVETTGGTGTGAGGTDTTSASTTGTGDGSGTGSTTAASGDGTSGMASGAGTSGGSTDTTGTGDGSGTGSVTVNVEGGQTTSVEATPAADTFSFVEIFRTPADELRTVTVIGERIPVGSEVVLIRPATASDAPDAVLYFDDQPVVVQNTSPASDAFLVA